MEMFTKTNKERKATLEAITKTQKKLLEILAKSERLPESQGKVSLRKDVINLLAKTAETELELRETFEDEDRKIQRLIADIKAVTPPPVPLRYWHPSAKRMVEGVQKIIWNYEHAESWKA